MKMIAIEDPSSATDVAELLLEEVKKDPQALALIGKLLKDPEADRNRLFATAYCMGVVHAIGAMMGGRIISVNDPGEPQSGPN